MLSLPSSSVVVKRLVSGFRLLLNPKVLRGLLDASEDRGRERYRRAGMSASASLIQKALTIVISFVSVPLTVHYLGPERYGVWLTISSLLVWMAMTDFGLAGNALINVLSEANGNDDRRAAQEYTSSAVWTLIVIAALFAIAALATFRFISWSAVFRVTTVRPGELTLTCALTLGLFIVGLPLSVQNSVYSAYQDGFLSSVWGIAMNISSLVALVTVTRFHGGLPQLVMALSGTRTFLGFMNVYYMFRKRYRWLAPVPSAVRWHCVRRLFKLGGKYLVSQLGALGIYQSQPMIITQILGPAQVMIFVVAQKVITLPMDLVYMVTAPLVPAFGEAKARNDWQWIRSAYHKVTLMSVAGAVPVLLLIAVVAKPLIRIWAGPEAIPHTSLILWLSVYNLLGVLFMGSVQLLIGIEWLAPLVLSVSLCALCTIGFGILGGRFIGLSGVAMAMALSKFAILCPIQAWAVRRVFSTKRGNPVGVTG